MTWRDLTERKRPVVRGARLVTFDHDPLEDKTISPAERSARTREIDAKRRKAATGVLNYLGIKR